MGAVVMMSPKNEDFWGLDRGSPLPSQMGEAAVLNPKNEELWSLERTPPPLKRDSCVKMTDLRNRRERER